MQLSLVHRDTIQTLTQGLIIGVVGTLVSLLNFFLQLSQIFDPGEIFGALTIIQSCTVLNCFSRLECSGRSKGLQHL